MSPEQEQFVNSFFTEHYEALVGHAFRVIRDWHLAKDIVQDSFGKLLDPKKMDEFLASENKIGWMKNVVKNTARNAMRIRRRELNRLIAYEELHEEPSAVDHYPSDEKDIVGAINRCLTKEELQLLKRLILDKVSYSEMAEELGLSVWSCYKRMQTIRNKLRDELEKNE